MKAKQYPTQEEINKLFYYENGKLFRKEKLPNQVDFTKEAGSLRIDGYRQIMVNRKTYYTHRLIYIMFFGGIPKDLVVDHIDENPRNSEIENLRLLTNVQNRIRSAKGYSWNKLSKKWYAAVRYLGKLIHLGCFDKEQDARDVYLKARKELYAI